MTSRIDLKGETFGQWTVLRYSHTDERGQAYWKCRCACGVSKAVAGRSLRFGQSRSCGGCGALDWRGGRLRSLEERNAELERRLAEEGNVQG